MIDVSFISKLVIVKVSGVIFRTVYVSCDFISVIYYV